MPAATDGKNEDDVSSSSPIVLSLRNSLPLLPPFRMVEEFERKRYPEKAPRTTMARMKTVVASIATYDNVRRANPLSLRSASSLGKATNAESLDSLLDDCGRGKLRLS